MSETRKLAAILCSDALDEQRHEGLDRALDYVRGGDTLIVTGSLAADTASTGMPSSPRVLDQFTSER